MLHFPKLLLNFKLSQKQLDLFSVRVKELSVKKDRPIWIEKEIITFRNCTVVRISYFPEFHCYFCNYFFIFCVRISICKTHQEHVLQRILIGGLQSRQITFQRLEK